MKKPFIICNWKMNPATPREAKKITQEIARITEAKKGTVIIAPPTLFIERVRALYPWVAGQDISAHAAGAYTGQISARMLRKENVSYVIVGHSERRKYQCETDEQIAQKIKQAHGEKITPIICVGETKKATIPQAWNKIKKQLDILIPSLVRGGNYIFAYEPVWAIGGNKEVDPKYATDIIYRIKLYVRTQTQEVSPVIYGGSVNCENIDSLLYYKNTIDGFLVGSASVKPKEIKNIIKKIYGSY